MNVMTWEEIEKELERENEEIKELTKLLSSGHTTFRHKRNCQEGLLHPCTEVKYPYQFTYFDAKGAVGDFRRNTFEEMAKSIKEYGFEACSNEQLQILS